MLNRVAVFLAIMAVSIAAVKGEEWNKFFAVTGRADLRVDARDGSVTVRGWDEKRISARVSATGWQFGPGQLEIIDRQSGDNVEINLRLPSQRWDFGRKSIRIEIQVPRDARLDIRTGDGSIKVSDVAGDVRLNTGDGSIDVTAVDGNLEARTGDGRIAARGRFDSLRLRTGDGSIDAGVMPGSKLAGGGRVETGDGSVTLRLPPDLAADLDVRTGDGSLSLDVPVNESERQKHVVRGKMNGGGPALLVRTGDGAVRVQRL